jgi:hypothetical protein
MSSISEKVKNVLIQSAEVVGGTIAEGALGYFTTGMSGAIAGATKGAAKTGIKRVTQNVLVDITNRLLSQREELRIGVCASYTINKINIYISEGKEPRYDFFNGDLGARTAGDEIFEGTLLKCKKEHEEKKIQFLSNIFSKVAFDENISLGEANYSLILAESMTYRQLCILALIENKSIQTDIKLKNQDYVQGEKSFELRSILNEIYELYNKGMIENYNSEHKRAYSLSGILSIMPNALRLTKHGKRQYEIMGLKDMDPSEFIDIWVQLS